jgi:hypothetical protein
MRPFASTMLGLAGWTIGCGVFAATAAAQAVAPAAAELPFTVADITLGTHVLGEELTPDSLQHRVVLLTFWSRESKACTECMPGLERLHRGLGPAGLLVVASHVDRGAGPEVLDTARKLGLTFPVFDDGSIKGLDTPDPPESLLFDHAGKCVAKGRPAEVAAKAAAAVAAAPPVVLAGRRLEKLAALERMLREEAKFGAVLRKAEGLTASEDGPTADEAGFLVDRLTGHGESLLAKAEELKGSDASEAAGLLQRVAVAYRGNDLGKKAADWQREWKRDKQFADGLQAAALAAQLESLRTQALAQVEPAGGRGRPRPGQRPGGPVVAGVHAGDKIPPQVKAQLAQLAGMVRQLSPGSKHASRAEEIAVELGLQLPPGQ